MSDTKEIIIPDPDEIRPRKRITRAEITQSIFRPASRWKRARRAYEG
jgi:hypothetical protein